MERITTKIVDLLKSEKLFYWQGGPVILAQVMLLIFLQDILNYRQTTSLMLIYFRP